MMNAAMREAHRSSPYSRSILASSASPYVLTTSAAVMPPEAGSMRMSRGASAWKLKPRSATVQLWRGDPEVEEEAVGAHDARLREDAVQVAEVALVECYLLAEA